MTEKEVKRKLAAILSADVKGYSRLMGEDELGTVNQLKEYRQVMASHIQRCGGRVVDVPGDNILSEFTSVVDALECAVEVQKELKKRNDTLPAEKKMEFRIGVNLGDVIEDGNRIYGEGINVAARIEGLADAGGVCVSGTAYDSIGKKLPFGYEYLGEQTVKNIEKPVRVYRVLTDPAAVGKVIGEKRFLGRISRRAAIAAIIILVVVAGGLIGWNIYLHQSRRVEAADPEKMAMASVIDYDPDTSSFKVDDDFGRNLTHVPLMMVRPTDDLIDYLEVQCDAYDFHLQSVLGIAPGPSYVYDIYPYNGHDWTMLPEDVALDFLEQWTLQIPTSGRIMADRNARWFWFTTTQDTSNMLSEFAWSVDAPNNALSLTATDNLEALTVDTLLAGLDPLSPMTVDVGGNLDGTGDDIYLRDWGTAVPTQVLRDGLPTGSWTVVQGTLRLHETDPGLHTWQVLP